ncbi:MAG: IclR family transcriptional regulator [Candidatus Limnocylindria bacterium]
MSTTTRRPRRLTQMGEHELHPAGDRSTALSAGGDIDDGNGAMAGAQVVDRVVDILETFTQLGPELGVSEISRALNLKKATAHRLLASLRRRGLVAQNPATRRYRLGMKLWELGSMATNHVEWIDRVKPFLQQLTERTGETTHLAVLSDGQVLYVDKVESAHSLRMPSQVGRRLPVHCTGIGKALVAFLPAEVLSGLIARRGMASFTPNTITDRRRLADELEGVRSRGYSIDNEEIEEGLVCIGAPVRDHTAHVVAAISIAGPSSRLRPDRVPSHAEAVVEAANTMSATLGCPPDLLRPVGA